MATPGASIADRITDLIGSEYATIPSISYIDLINAAFNEVADTMSIGNINPFAYPLSIARTLHRLANDERVNEGDIAGFVNSPEGKKSLISLWDKDESEAL